VLSLNGGSAPPPPPPPTTRRPDALIKATSDTTYVGDNIYNTDGANQTKSLTVRGGKTANYDIQVQNDGSASDSFKVGGSTGTSSLSVKYSVGNTDVTAAVNA